MPVASVAERSEILGRVNVRMTWVYDRCLMSVRRFELANAKAGFLF